MLLRSSGWNCKQSCQCDAGAKANGLFVCSDTLAVPSRLRRVGPTETRSHIQSDERVCAGQGRPRALGRWTRSHHHHHHQRCPTHHRADRGRHLATGRTAQRSTAVSSQHRRRRRLPSRLPPLPLTAATRRRHPLSSPLRFPVKTPHSLDQTTPACSPLRLSRLTAL